MDTEDIKVVRNMSLTIFESELIALTKGYEESNLKVEIDYKPLLNAKDQVIHLALVRVKG